MQNEHEFLLAASAALDSLKRHLIAREDEQPSGITVDDHNGKLRVLFEKSNDQFVIAPNPSLCEIWVSAPASNLQLLWDSRTEKFLFPPTGENLLPLIDRLISEHHTP
jgi:frataxin-like iron-binding protein CyaY